MMEKATYHFFKITNKFLTANIHSFTITGLFGRQTVYEVKSLYKTNVALV